jgi:hypothetical protein
MSDESSEKKPFFLLQIKNNMFLLHLENEFSLKIEINKYSFRVKEKSIRNDVVIGANT